MIYVPLWVCCQKDWSASTWPRHVPSDRQRWQTNPNRDCPLFWTQTQRSPPWDGLICPWQSENRGRCFSMSCFYLCPFQIRRIPPSTIYIHTKNIKSLQWTHTRNLRDKDPWILNTLSLCTFFKQNTTPNSSIRALCLIWVGFLDLLLTNIDLKGGVNNCTNTQTNTRDYKNKL